MEKKKKKIEKYCPLNQSICLRQECYAFSLEHPPRQDVFFSYIPDTDKKKKPWCKLIKIWIE